ncbi:unnamed protein product [Caenorhabditis sp. 36 PRJEB53466]|nr:unnamed protein product [Caenorhabditis sp. 36 PRJEB53466]
MSTARSAKLIVKNETTNQFFMLRALYRLTGVANQSSGWQMIKPEHDGTPVEITFPTGVTSPTCEFRLHAIKYQIAEDPADPLAITFDGRRLVVEELFVPDKNNWFEHTLVDADNEETIEIAANFPIISIKSAGKTTVHLFRRADL